MPRGFIWMDTQVERNVFVLFRRCFHLEQVPEQASLNLFADSRYRLRVNGCTVAHGPARFAPQQPEYDSFDLRPWLREGHNVIFVEVNGFGTDSAERVSGGRSGFIAWGQAGDVDWSTPGLWQSRTAEDVWDSRAIKFSFIQNAVEVRDTRRFDPAWLDARSVAARDGWTEADLIEDDSAWGPLEPRSVPNFTETLDRPARLLQLSRLKDDEMRLGARALDANWKEHGREAASFAYAFWIHSPVEQTLSMGLLWGDNFLNGRKMEQTDVAHCADRQQAELPLRQGWNLLYGETAMLLDVWTASFALPRGHELAVAAEPDADCGFLLKHTTALPRESLPMATGSIPTDEASLEGLGLQWECVAPGGPCHHPSRMMRWDRIAKVERADTRLELPIELPLDDCGMWDVSLDYGREFHGRLVLDLEAPAGTVVDVLYEEKLRPDGLPGRLDFAFNDPADSYILRGGRQLIEGFHDRGGRYMRLALRAENPQAGAKVVVHSVAIRSAEVPVADAGRFVCGDPIYNWAWRVSADTLRINQCDVYLPDVWRERGLAVADNRLSTPMNRALEADMRVSRRSVEIFRHGLDVFPDGMLNAYMPAQPTGPFADFSLIWPIWVEDHWNLSGDNELVQRCMPAMRRVVNGSVWQAAKSGLWNATPYKPFIDWGANKETVEADENAAINIYRIAALESIARLSDRALGAHEAAKEFHARARELRRILQERLWLGEQGRFAVGTRQGEPWSQPPSPHVNVLALLFDCAPEQHESRVLDYIRPYVKENLQSCISGGRHRRNNFQMLFLHYVLEVLYRHGQAALAEDFLRDHWGYMRQQGAWTTWESLTDQRPSSQCHVWSASPLIHAMRHVLGVRQEHPGRPDAFVIEPLAETIDWAQGAYPLADAQTLEVRWQLQGGVLHARVDAPAGIQIRFAPRGRLASLPKGDITLGHAQRHPSVRRRRAVRGNSEQ